MIGKGRRPGPDSPNGGRGRQLLGPLRLRAEAQELAAVTKNNGSTLNDQNLVWHKLRRLVMQGVMSKVEERHLVVNALSVVVKLVWEVRKLNKLMNVKKLTLEALDDTAELQEEKETQFKGSRAPKTSRQAC